MKSLPSKIRKYFGSSFARIDSLLAIYFGHAINNIPTLHNLKRDFSQYYSWPVVPSQLYKNVPNELRDKYDHFIKFGRLKKWLFDRWRSYISQKIGRGEIDAKSVWSDESGEGKHLWNLANFEEIKINRNLNFCKKIIGLLETVRPSKILEIGCGCGGWLSYFARHYPSARYYGYDVNERTIMFCQRYYSSTNNVSFYSGSADEVLREIKPDVIIFITTAMFIGQKELINLLASIKQNGVKQIVFYEPITLPFDFSFNFDSSLRGKGADTFNHNYPFILKSLGYDVILEELMTPCDADKYKWQAVRDCMIVGKL